MTYQKKKNSHYDTNCREKNKHTVSHGNNHMLYRLYICYIVDKDKQKWINIGVPTNYGCG